MIMNILKSTILCATLGLSICENTKTGETISKPLLLKKLQIQEESLIKELQDLSSSKLHAKTIDLALKTAQVKVDKQAKINKEPATEDIPLGTTQYWNRQIAIAQASIEGLQDLLNRKQDPKQSPAKISKNLKAEHVRTLQEPDSRNQSLES